MQWLARVMVPGLSLSPITDFCEVEFCHEFPVSCCPEGCVQCKISIELLKNKLWFFFVRFRFTIRFGRVSYIVPLFLPNDTMPTEAQMDWNWLLAHFKTIVDIDVAIRFGSVFDMWPREVLVNERIHHMCNSDCMRPCSVIQNKKQKMFSVKKGCNKLLCGEIFLISSCTCLEKVVIYTIVRAVSNQRTEHKGESIPMRPGNIQSFTLL